jgi:hypothetical protein
VGVRPERNEDVFGFRMARAIRQCFLDDAVDAGTL